MLLASPVAILVNGASSFGKSTLCRALQDQLTQLADGDPAAAYGLVAFDDFALLLSDRLFPLSLVRLQGGDLSRLVSRQPHDGCAWSSSRWRGECWRVCTAAGASTSSWAPT